MDSRKHLESALLFFPNDIDKRNKFYEDVKKKLAKKLLYIEPSKRVSSEPVIDVLTRKMAAAFRQRTVSREWLGYHECACGAKSSPCDYSLPNGLETNSLCIHYLAMHRDEVYPEELAKVAQLEFGEADPTDEEIKDPKMLPELEARWKARAETRRQEETAKREREIMEGNASEYARSVEEINSSEPDIIRGGIKTLISLLKLGIKPSPEILKRLEGLAEHPLRSVRETAKGALCFTKQN